MHEVGEERDRARRDEDRRLHESSDAEDREADEDGADAGTRAHDRAIDEAMRVTVLTVVVRVPAVVTVGVLVHHRRPRSPNRPELDERRFTCVVDLQRRVLDPELVVQQPFELAAASVAVLARTNENVRRQRREART